MNIKDEQKSLSNKQLPLAADTSKLSKDWQTKGNKNASQSFVKNIDFCTKEYYSNGYNTSLLIKQDELFIYR